MRYRVTAATPPVVKGREVGEGNFVEECAECRVIALLRLLGQQRRIAHCAEQVLPFRRQGVPRADCRM
jgi:hypothetical protein